ncbi:hypothetical protein [Nocardioides panacisoli]|uniref:Integrase SAM-like N-terminal domain-containing protein n=1 Tax=Nocardioides panacisoli TaxID=627624 RepID=A0ABP7I584_9ACTN
MASIAKRDNGQWRARYRDGTGKEYAGHFDRKVDAQRWLDEQTAKLVAGTHVSPRQARVTVGEWCDTWLEGYRGKRKSTVRQAEVHIARIRATFGHMQLNAVRPSHVRTWCAQLAAEGLADSYIYALHPDSLSCLLTPSMTDWFLGHRALGGLRRSRASSGRTSARPTRCGRSTTRCPSTCARRRSSGPSPASGSPRRAACASRTSTSCAESFRRPCSTRASR